jgi:hypothetical protein
MTFKPRGSWVDASESWRETSEEVFNCRSTEFEGDGSREEMAVFEEAEPLSPA